MPQLHLIDSFAENPEYLLVLMLSTPNSGSRELLSAVTVEFTATEILARVKQPAPLCTAPRILASKQTIFASVLLYHLIMQRGSVFAESLIRQAESFSVRAASINTDFSPNLNDGLYPPLNSPDADSSSFFKELNVMPGDLEAAQRKTRGAFAFLEREGLTVDPAFTPELLVLAGLIPIQFSVRTPKGEHVYREIKIKAALWSLDITKDRRDGAPYTDFEFKFHGIQVVRRALEVMATHYLESEESTRKARGQPVLPRKYAPNLDDE